MSWNLPGHKCQSQGGWRRYDLDGITFVGELLGLCSGFPSIRTPQATTFEAAPLVAMQRIGGNCGGQLRLNSWSIGETERCRSRIDTMRASAYWIEQS